MFDYTKAAVAQTVKDFKKIDFIRNVATQTLYIAYLIYAICVGAGVLAANIVLLVLSASYFALFLFMTLKPPTKQVRETVKTIFTRSKQTVKLYTLVVMIYGVWLTADRVTPLSLILSALMITGWVLQILFEVVFKFFLNRANFIIEGMEADYENITKPVRTVGNFFKKVTGKEVEEEKAPTKTRLFLEEKVRLAREERRRKKEEAAEARRAAAEQKKAEKQRKNAKQATTETAVSSTDDEACQSENA